MRGRRGMTLVEVMVVVAILFLVLGVLTTGVFQVFGESQVDTARLRAARDTERAEVRALRSNGDVGRLERASFWGRAEVQPVLSGLTLHTLVEGQVTGRFEFEVDGAEAIVPVNDHLESAWAVVGGERLPVSIEDRLMIVPAQDGRAVLEAQWDVSTFNLLEFDLGVEPVHTEVEMVIDQGTLGGMSFEEGTWHHSGTEVGSLVIPVTADGTRLGVARDLGLLGAFGMLLFGLGFWYSSEGERPGLLEDFRLGGVLLLGLNYALFYAVVVGLLVATSLPISVAVGMGLVIASPLLALHLTHLTDRRFGLGRALPLGLLTWVLITVLAAAPELRTLVAALGSVCILAVVTLTWKAWTAARDAFHREQMAQWQRKSRSQLLEDARQRLRSAVALQRGRLRAADRALRSFPSGLGAATGTSTRASRRLDQLLDRAEEELAQPLSLASDAQARAQVEDLNRIEEQLTRASEQLSEALVALEGTAETVHARVGVALEQLARVGEELEVEAPEATELQALRRMIQARVESGAEDPVLLLAEAKRLTRRAEHAVKHAVSPPDGLHCSRCGHPHSSDSRFCAGCGLQRPPVADCDCGAAVPMPIQLLAVGWQDQRICCTACGEGLRLTA